MKPFKRSQRNLQSQIMKHFLNATVVDIDDIEFIFDKEFHFLSQEDIDGIMGEIVTDKDGFESCQGDTTKIVEYLIKKTEMYPNKESREEFMRLVKKPNVRIANDDGCRDENCRFGYSVMRTGIYEVLELDKSIRRFIQNPESKLIDLEDFLIDK